MAHKTGRSATTSTHCKRGSVLFIPPVYSRLPFPNTISNTSELQAEDEPGEEDAPECGGAADVPGADPGGEADRQPEGPAGGGPDVPEEPQADGWAAVRAGVGVDGDGVDGAASAAGTGQEADVWAVPGEQAEQGADWGEA